MTSRRGSHSASQPPGANWEDSYFSLEERYRQLRKQLNEREQELKLQRVAQRRATAATRDADIRGTTMRWRGVRGGQRARGKHDIFPGRHDAKDTSVDVGDIQWSPSHVVTPLDPAGVVDELHEASGGQPGTTASVPVESVAIPDAIRSAVIANAALWSPAGTLPDPSMVWGSEGSVQNYVAASALYHANEELRRKLAESSTLMQTLQQELSSSRTLCINTQAKVDDLAQQMHQLVRERDLATQKLATAKITIGDLERTLQGHLSEEEKCRFALESQITELRSRLVVGADSNELLNRDVRALLAESKEKSSLVMSLRSKLALAESALSSQKHTNENLLVELKSLNTQLMDDRKRLLSLSHEAELGEFRKDHVRNLEGQIRRLSDERNSIEHEHVQLMSSFVHLTGDALREARSEVQADLDEWRSAAQHWEEVAQLLYKDVAERLKTHLRCREECEEAKAHRDRAVVECRVLKEEIVMCKAKLETVWPTHVADTMGLDAEEVLETFSKRRQLFGVGHTHHTPGRAEGKIGIGGQGDSMEAMNLPGDDNSPETQIRELHEANAWLSAELQQLRVTNDLLQQRFETITDRQSKAEEAMKRASQKMETREDAGRKVLAKQLDRVDFLEAQVRSLRGYQVQPNTPLDTIEPTENILELFLGQLLPAQAPAGLPVPDAFAVVFCSADFLLHETVTTPTLTGWNGFFDTTISFRIAMDTLLLYYLKTRELLVQLHRVRPQEELEGMLAERELSVHMMRLQDGGSVTGNTNDVHPSCHSDVSTLSLAELMFETIAEGRVSLLDIVMDEKCRTSPRPVLKGHIKLCTPSGQHIASLEFHLTARLPFSTSFQQAIAEMLTLDPHPQATECGGTTAIESHVQAPASKRKLLWSPNWSTSSSSGNSSTSRAVKLAVDRAKRLQVATSAEPSSMLAETQSASLTSSPDGERTVRRRTPPAPPPPSRPPYQTHAQSVGHLYHTEKESTRQSSSRQAKDLRGDLTVSLRNSETGCVTPGSGQDLLRYPSSDVRVAAATPEPAIRALYVDITEVQLPRDWPRHIPRLSCYYSISPLRRDVHLAAPPTPRYTIVYTQDGEPGRGTCFPLHSDAELAAVAREPLTLYFIDDDAPSSALHGGTLAAGRPVWAIAVAEWTAALAQPQQYTSAELPLVESNGSTMSGAVVRLRLMASTTPPLQAYLASSATRLIASSIIPQTPFTHSNTAFTEAQSFGSPPQLPHDAQTLEEEMLRMEYDRIGPLGK